MAENRKQMSRAQEKAKTYIDEHNIEKIISEMLNSLVHARDPKPLIFMVSWIIVIDHHIDKIPGEPCHRIRIERSWYRS